MAPKPRVYLDTSALFAGIWSTSGGGRMILRLGEAEALVPLTGSIILDELERTLKEKAPQQLGTLAVLLDKAQFEVLPSPSELIVNEIAELVDHPGDALVFATALNAEVDYFATLDRKHFLRNKKLVRRAPFPMGTPGDFLHWFRQKMV